MEVLRLTLGTVKGSAMCSSFAAGKFAMRATAQSLAREFGPKGIHVVHAIIDGVIDIERTKHWTFEHEDAKIKPESVSCFSGSENRVRNLSVDADLTHRLPTHIGIFILSIALVSPMRSTSDLMSRSGRWCLLTTGFTRTCTDTTTLWKKQATPIQFVYFYLAQILPTCQTFRQL
jgi:hypothetical protein